MPLLILKHRLIFAPQSTEKDFSTFFGNTAQTPFLDEGSDLLMWVKAVATAILAGVIAQILVQPPGALASIPAALRYGAVVAGFAAFLLTRRSIFAGVVCGEVVMLAGKWWLG